MNNKDTWLIEWAQRCGVMLVAGFIIPVIISLDLSAMMPAGMKAPPGMESQTHWIWFWNTMSGAGFITTLLPLAAGVALLVLKDRLEGEKLVLACLAISAGALILMGIIASTSTPSVRGMGHPGAAMGNPSSGSFGIILFLLSIMTIAIGNHLNKSQFGSKIPGLMIVSGGGVLLLFHLLPIAQGQTLLGLIFTGQMWKLAWFVMPVIVATLAYSGLAIWHFIQGGMENQLSLLVRVIAFGAPVLIIVGNLFSASPVGFFSMISMVLKFVLIMYGFVLMISVSLSALLEAKLTPATPDQPAEAADADAE